MDKLVEQWAAIPQQQRYLAVGGIILLLIGGYWYFYHTASQKNLARLVGDRARLSQEKDKQTQYVQRIGQYEARFNQLQQDLNEARSQLPDEADVPQLLAQLDNAARQSGLQIENFEPTGEDPKDFYSEVGVNMEVRGSFHEIGTFVDAVGKMDRIVNVKDIQMTGPKVVNKKVMLTSKFAIKTYRFINKPKGKKKDAKKK